jgi:PAS domain-containing protein
MGAMFDVEPTPLPPPPVELTRYAVAGRYVLEGPLGEGGMGRVHRVRHRHLGRAFALKVIAPSFRDAHDARARFIEEARLASEMRHPNIVEVVDFGDDPALGAFMVMELIEGAPLLDPAAPPPTLARVCEYLRQIADALDHIHRHGVLHGDLKPDNILVSTEAAQGRKRAAVKLLDFGLARRIEHAGDEPLAGSPSYIAPERITGGPPSVAADVYALGVLAYELITGAPPFVGELLDVLQRHVHEPPAPLVTSRGGEPVDEALAALVARALAKAPDDRHRSIGDLRYELQNVMAMLGLRQRRATDRGGRDRLLAQGFELVSLPQALLDGDDALVVVNAAFAKMLGRAPAELVGVAARDTALGEAFPELAAACAAARAEAAPIERLALVGDGAQRVQVALWLARTSAPGAELHAFLRLRRWREREA